MTPTRWLGPVIAFVMLTAGCTGTDDANTSPTPSAAPSPPPTAAPPPPRPKRLACLQLTFDAALAPSDSGRVIPCRRAHTGQTYAVGQLGSTVDGHLLAVDSDRVQRQVARTCPRKLAAFLGASEESLRLSLLRAVWFTPSLEESDAGANWYRCDVVAVAGDNRLATFAGSLEGAFTSTQGAAPFAMCGTAPPDSADFARVLCREQHTWRAIDTVDLQGRRYPGEKRARAAGQDPCNQAAREVADDVLDYEWGYEWPTEEQWAGGQDYGLCWAPV